MSSSGRPETRTQILEAARAMFEEHGYHGAGLAAVAKTAGVSRQAIYLHFPSKAELLTELHLHIFATDVVPAVRRHPVTDAMTAWEAIDATIASTVPCVSALTTSGYSIACLSFSAENMLSRLAGALVVRLVWMTPAR